MIRIDEIYCNTFLPLMQDRPLHGLHWFDPFGSVKFEDLRSLPSVPWHEQSVRYLFWDQEPLHKHTIDITLAKFKRMYNGQHHIITSEQNSDMVKYVVDTYGFQNHYYFFHGWASLDWFRGYHRSFLIKPPEQRTITKTFVMPNRIVGGERIHRLLMFYHIVKNQLLDNHISFPKTCPAENTSVVDLAERLVGLYPDLPAVLSTQSLPLQFANETDHPMTSYKLDMFDQAAESLLYLVTETVATGRRQHLTEKSFKPICLQMPFVTVGTAGSLDYLRSYGFHTFGHLWDESYDQEIDDVKRVEKIGHLLKELDSLSDSERQHLFEQSIPIVTHNYNHFYGGAFEQVLWNELNAMIKKFFDQ
jgi:hypothetical protein